MRMHELGRANAVGGVRRRTDGCRCHLLPAIFPGSPRIADGCHLPSGGVGHAASAGERGQEIAGCRWGPALPTSVAADRHVAFPPQQLRGRHPVVDDRGSLLPLGSDLGGGGCTGVLQKQTIRLSSRGRCCLHMASCERGAMVHIETPGFF